jgi:hypothetical protein
MKPAMLRQLAQRHWALLLWLALLIPVAQLAAQAHPLSHGVAQTKVLHDGPVDSGQHCDLCLSASAVSGGALLGAPAALQHAPARHAAPFVASRLVWTAARASPYRSRASPLSLH